VVILLFNASRPAMATLGRLPGTRGRFVDIDRDDDAKPVDDLLIMRLDTPLYYFNATAVSDQVLSAVDAAEPTPWAVLIDVEATIELDVTTADALLGLIGSLEDRDTRLVIVHAKGRVRDRMAKVGLVDRLGAAGMYPTEQVAVEALAVLRKEEDDRKADAAPDQESESSASDDGTRST